MADPLWPASVPSDPEIGNYRESVISGNASFQPDAGPPTAWRMSTLDSLAVQASFILNAVKVRNGTDETTPGDYFADAGDPRDSPW